MEVSDEPEVEAVAEEDEGEIVLYQVGVSPKQNIFASGNEPLLLLRELSELGESKVVVSLESVPVLEDLDPEQCYLTWSVDVETDRGEDAIRGGVRVC